MVCLVLQVLISATTYQRICGRLDELRLPALQKAYALPSDSPGMARRMAHKRPAGLWSSFQMAMSMTKRSASCSMSGPSSHSHNSQQVADTFGPASVAACPAPVAAGHSSPGCHQSMCCDCSHQVQMIDAPGNTVEPLQTASFHLMGLIQCLWLLSAGPQCTA